MPAYPEYQLPIDQDLDPDDRFPPPPPASLDSLVAQRLALVVEQLAGTEGPTLVMGFPGGLPRRPRHGVEMEIEEGGDESIFDLLLGVTFPEDWRAVAVAGACRWFSDEDRGREDGRVAVAIDRAGRHSSTLVSRSRTFTSLTGVGRIVDLLRVGFGLATAPPAGRPTEFLRAVWLDRVVDRAGWDGSLGWFDLETLQPGFGPQATWADVHQAVAVGDLVVPGCPAKLARWFDTGTFARNALDLLPPDSDLMAAAIELLPPALVGLICDSLCQDW